MPAENFTLIKHVRLINSAAQKIENCDILFRRAAGNRPSEIIEIGKGLHDPDLPNAVTTQYKGAGLYACRSFVDLHMHICEPGAMSKEDIRTATLAAVRGGYGSLLALPDRNVADWRPNADKSLQSDPLFQNLREGEPIPDALIGETVLSYIYSNAAARSSCELKAASYLTVRNWGEQLCNIDQLLNRKAAALYDDGHTPPALLYTAMKACAVKDVLLILRPEAHYISNGGAVSEGIARVMHCAPISVGAEIVPLTTALALAAETHCRLHITLVSTALSVQMIREAKARGVRVTCDTAPQYFTLTQSDLPLYGSLAKVNPPLRSAEDREAILTALADGTIDCIVSDHTPESEESKRLPLAKASFGMIGLQSTFALCMQELVRTRRLSLYRLIELLSVAPAKILGLPESLRPGVRADLNLLDLDREYTLTEKTLCSKSKNCPWLGQSFIGSVERNFYNGR